MGMRFFIQPVSLDLPEDTLADHHVFQPCPDVVSPFTTSFFVYSSRGIHSCFIVRIQREPITCSRYSMSSLSCRHPLLLSRAMLPAW
eukprot:7691487-Heterocapsa_arctica.AAC.1